MFKNLLVSALSIVLPTSVYAEVDLFNMALEDLLSMSVTGSKIKTRTLSDFVSVKAIDRQAIEASGAITLDEVLLRLPEVAGFSASSHNAYWGEGEGVGASRINLRGLGAHRTLVLLNGRRLANGGLGANKSPNLNAIPLAIVESIEVLSSGASAIYGTDAIAGVINIVTQNKGDGQHVDISYGESSRGDGERQSLDFTWQRQKSWGDVNFFVSRTERHAVEMAARAPCGLLEMNNNLVCYDTGSTYGGKAVLIDDGSVINFNEELGGNSDFYTDYDPLVHNANINQFLNAFNPADSTHVGASGWYGVSDSTKLVFELMYADVDTYQAASPDTIGRSREITLAGSHPTNPTGKDLILQRRRLGEAGGRIFQQKSRFKDFVFGLEGELGESWNWKTAFSWRYNDNISTESNESNLDRVDATLDINVCSNNPGADIPCGDYLGVGDVSQPVLDYIMIDYLTDTGENEQFELSSDFTGTIEFGSDKSIGVASGVVLRKTKGERIPDLLDTKGIANTNPTAPLSGEYSAREVYAEIDIPIANGFVLHGDQLDLNAAARYSDYDNFGDSFNYKIDISWDYDHRLSVYSTLTTGFRVPSIDEYFLASDKERLNTKDPCNDWGGLPSDSIARQKCEEEGVPSNYRQTNIAIPTTIGGSEELVPETARTINVGFVFKPSDNLIVGANLVKTKLEEAIESISGATRLNVCYNSINPSEELCKDENLKRNSITHEIDFLKADKDNIAQGSLSAIDLLFEYKFNIYDYLGKLTWDTTYTFDYKKIDYPGASETELAGQIISGSGSYTKWRSLLMLGVETQKWQHYYGVKYIGGAKDNTSNPDDIGHYISSVRYHNIRSVYSALKNVNIYFGINNLFDETAPYVAGWLDGNTDTMTYDLTGRSFYIGMNVEL